MFTSALLHQNYCQKNVLLLLLQHFLTRSLHTSTKLTFFDVKIPNMNPKKETKISRPNTDLLTKILYKLVRDIEFKCPNEPTFRKFMEH